MYGHLKLWKYDLNEITLFRDGSRINHQDLIKEMISLLLNKDILKGKNEDLEKLYFSLDELSLDEKK